VKKLLDELGCQLISLDHEKDRNQAKDSKALEDLVAEKVIETSANLGMCLNNNGEHIVLIDEKGNVLSDDHFIALVALIILRANDGGTVVVPITASRTIEDLARKHNGKVIRTKTGPQSFMEKVLNEEIFLDQGKLSQFFFNFDALRALTLTLEYITSENMRLSELLEDIPSFYLSKKTIECPWEAKGKVMRTLIEEKQDGEIELIDGVKVYHKDGWALVLPDPEDPLCRVYSEGYSQEIAESLTDMYIDKIKLIKDGTGGA
jgi:mannose-1-phosphate guanylyltransferase / phosphomannomutase